jgi:dTDP-4-amino-4,6-dideoxygalactose transaminase
MTSNYIPFHLPSIGQEEIDEVAAALRSGWLTSGPRTQQFEAEFKTYVRAHHALAVNSATAGLHLALAALDIGPGDEVITTPMTFCATVNTILEVGAKPVLADIQADGNIDPASIAARITPRTRAIMPVHIAGLPCRMEEIWTLAAQHGLRVIEDAAHAIGSEYRGLRIGQTEAPEGRRSDAVVFSFYATKNLTTGEGGMITTGNEALYERMRRLALHGISKDAWKRYTKNGSWFYEVVECGFKYNLSDLQSAVGIHQLHRQEEFIRVRTEYARMYRDILGGLDELELPPEAEDCRHCWHLYLLRLNLENLNIDRAAFIEALRAEEIGASVHFIPIPLHPAYAEFAGLPENHCPRALALYPRLVSLPLYPAMTRDQVERVAFTVRKLIGAARKQSQVCLSKST